ncbi:MAG: hypothetical protein U0793_30985 [Gemmataceae bacterium]
MLRLHLLVIYTFSALAIVSLFADRPEEVEGTADALTRRIEQRREFVTQLERCERDLAGGSRSLREVSRRLRDYCEVFYPYFLEDVLHAESGDTLDRKIASNLIRIFRVRLMEQEHAAQTREIITRLQRELDAW